MKKLVNQVLGAGGLELRRTVDASIPKKITTVVDGVRRSFWITNPFTMDWWDRPEIEMDGELSELKRITERGDSVLEIGSHHGMLTLMLSQWIGDQGVVYAVEAEASNSLTLEANCFANSLENVQTYHVAIGREAGVVKFGGESLAAASGTVREVRMETADDFLTSNVQGKIDLLKIDVEGFEAEVLSAAGQLLSQKPKLALELHVDLLSEAGSSAREVWDILHDSGMLDDRAVTAVCRPDWKNVFSVSGFEDLPTKGVVNLFVI